MAIRTAGLNTLQNGTCLSFTLSQLLATCMYTCWLVLICTPVMFIIRETGDSEEKKEYLIGNLTINQQRNELSCGALFLQTRESLSNPIDLPISMVRI